MSTVENSTIARHHRRHRRVAPVRPVPTTDLVVGSAAYFRWKTFFDRPLAALLLVPGLPIIGLLVALVRLTSRGPGIFRQSRVGLHGRKFMMYKIRTMRIDAEAATGAAWSQCNDPRVTRVGRVLRKLHLDELPQLFNIVKGEMWLVGPRPERPEFVRVLAEAIPNYRSRLAVRPGVTGLAQLNLPPDTDLESVRRKLVLDCEYIECAGLFLDIRLFACTGLRMLKVPESWTLRLFGLRRSVTVPTIFGAPSGNGSNDSNGSKGADAMGHAAVAVTSIQCKIAQAMAQFDGNSPGHHQHPDKRAAGGHGWPKPR